MFLKNYIKENFRWISVLGISVFVFILYANSIGNKYSLDDEMVTSTYETKNHKIERGIKGIPSIFRSRGTETEKQNYSYRPLVLTTFAVEYQIFGRNPHISHLVNILLYTLICILIFFILSSLFSEKQAVFAVLVTLLFAAHPLHTEPVNNIKSRDELLMLFLSLVSVRHFIWYVENNKIKHLVFGILLLVLAILSKRTAIVFIFIIPLILYYFKNIPLKKILFFGLMTLAGFVLFFIIKKTMLHGKSLRHFLYFENPLYYEKGFMKKVPAALYTLWAYLGLIFLPVKQSFYYGFNQVQISGWGNWTLWASLVIHLSAFIYALRTFLAKSILSFAILFYFFAIGPFSNLIIPAPGIIADRFAFIATLGFCIALVFVLLKLFNSVTVSNSSLVVKYNPFFSGFFLILLFLFSFRTITRNPDWKDLLSLYRHDIKHLENSAKAHSLISNTIYPKLFDLPEGILRENLIKECISHYKKSIEIYPDYITSNNNLGSIYFTFLGDFTSAAQYFQKAISLDTGYVEAYYNLAYSLEKLEKKDSAIFYYEKTLLLKPDYKLPYDQLYPLYYSFRLYDKAINLNLQGAANFPELSAMYFVNAGNMCSAKSDTIKALSFFIKALEKEPRNKDLCFHIGKVYKKINDHENALKYFQLAEELQKNR